jgi:hypothetical protein
MAVRFMVAFLLRSGDPYYFTLPDIPGDRFVSFRLLNTVRRRRLRVAIVQALSHWQKDSTLSCFHDKAAQDKQVVTAFAPKIEPARPQVRAALIDAMRISLMALRGKRDEGLGEPESAAADSCAIG